MKTSYLILASLAAAVVAAPESDCSERRDSREVCPISQRRMTPAPSGRGVDAVKDAIRDFLRTGARGRRPPRPCRSDVGSRLRRNRSRDTH
mmetsp:Transcript_7501/g.20922  ORF Transcript_7501/g.20922 Transcript_7501/m.20922 type:complete len:91 (+) Transcript_7501:474-746(+)